MGQKPPACVSVRVAGGRARARLEHRYQTRINAVPRPFGAAAGARPAANCGCAVSFREIVHAGGGEDRRQAGDARSLLARLEVLTQRAS